MIASLGPYANFILLSYAAATLAALGLTLWVILDHRRLRHTLTALEARGLTRRSARAAARLAPETPLETTLETQA
ncbi:heme exporter protein CcmD [Pleomorphomonas diazotrophica]|uniref:Heme exporter protein D n=1 Tax=Pleomorphomonas diazotrophica TaxID=1166257 RepID=A0A1I4SXX5_9HYPH|nr:heme exporter protein CcmD [Pleomorphomonas diazotrophica]PKR88611.1 heme exporter protein CcmD [Pleomorphomonas diazotrophica]SFM69257.1 heme exporter protein D [Pleomorphomonas diazotrophica]